MRISERQRLEDISMTDNEPFYYSTESYMIASTHHDIRYNRNTELSRDANYGHFDYIPNYDGPRAFGDWWEYWIKVPILYVMKDFRSLHHLLDL